MSDSDTSARPRQLTMAGVVRDRRLGVLLVSVFDAITNLNSVDTRDQVAELLSSPTGEGLGLSVAQALSAIRVGLMVTGAVRRGVSRARVSSCSSGTAGPGSR